MALKTNYKDDILDLTQNANRKYEEIENQDGSISFNDVTVYEETGDTYGATDINATNTVVNSHNSALQVGTNETDLIRFAKDGSGNYGYKKVGSETFYPFQTKHTETYRPTSRANNLDMGEYHKKRYVDTTAVPNTNSGTYPNNTGITANGTYDMGATNTNRYVKVAVTNVNPVANCKSNTFNNTTTGYVSGLTVGQKYLLIVCQFKWSGNSYPIDIVSGATIIEGLTEMWHAIVANSAYMWLATVTATATSIGVSIDSTAQNVSLTAVPLL